MNADDLYHKYYINNRNNRDGQNVITVLRMRNHFLRKSPLSLHRASNVISRATLHADHFGTSENAINYRPYQHIFGLVASREFRVPQTNNFNFCNQLDNLCYTHYIYRLTHMLVDPVMV